MIKCKKQPINDQEIGEKKVILTTVVISMRFKPRGQLEYNLMPHWRQLSSTIKYYDIVNFSVFPKENPMMSKKL